MYDFRNVWYTMTVTTKLDTTVSKRLLISLMGQRMNQYKLGKPI